MNETHQKRNLLQQLLKNDSGVAAVEFAMISGLFLVMLFGVVEATRAIWAKNTLQYAIEEAARERIINEDMTTEELTDFVIGRMDGLVNTSTVSINVTTTTTASGVDILNIEGTYDYTMMLPLLPDAMSSFELTANTHMPI